MIHDGFLLHARRIGAEVVVFVLLTLAALACWWLIGQARPVQWVPVPETAPGIQDYVEVDEP